MLLASASTAAAAERYALIVTGAAGGDEYAQKYEIWRTRFAATLRDALGIAEANVVTLSEAPNASGRTATAAHVRAALGELARRVTKADVLLVLLIGHGTGGDGDDAKFNLVGPDLTAAEWAALIKPVAGTVVFVNGASGSFPFLEALAGRGRIVVTAADSPAQQFETVFPGMFIGAFDEGRGDTDKDGRVSVWEAFVYAAAGVSSAFEERGQLATERPLLDDTGDGVGIEAPGPAVPPQPASNDGVLARATFLQTERAPAPATTGGVPSELEQRRAAVAAELDALRASKGTMPADEYERRLETLLLELATIDRERRR
jgi:hypothetical protein